MSGKIKQWFYDRHEYETKMDDIRCTMLDYSIKNTTNWWKAAFLYLKLSFILELYIHRGIK